jgi:hypothetical protein
MLGVSDDSSVFSINTSWDIHNLSFLIDYKTVLVSEELPMSWVLTFGSEIIVPSLVWNSHVMRSPVSIEDCLGCAIECPPLLLSILCPSLEENCGVTLHLSDSLHWKSGSEVEWSTAVESEVGIKSLGLDSLSLVKIDNSPSLVGLSVVAPDNCLSSFFVSSTMNIKYLLVGPVDELLLLVLEELPPIRVSAPDLHVLVSSGVLNIPWLVIQLGSNSERSLIEPPDLSIPSIPGLDNHVSVVDEVKVSVLW